MDPYDDTSRMWGGAGRGADSLSLLELVRNDTLDLTIASILWLLVEKKASIVVAAGPQLAGKTTLLMALMDFAPPTYRKVYTRGVQEDFSFLRQTTGSETYAMVPELSDHTPAYLWGDGARRLFEATREGYSVAATMHADSPEEVVAMLSEPPVSLTDDLVAGLDTIVTLLLVRGGQGLFRRVAAVSVLDAASLVSADQGYARIARWDAASDTFSHEGASDTVSVLAARFGLGEQEVQADLALRTETLRAWMDRSSIDADAVGQMVAQHHGA